MRQNENCRCRRLFITEPCVTALVEAFCILRGVLTKKRMCVQLDDASNRVLAIQFDFWKFIVFMLGVFTAHFSPVKCS